MFLLQFLFIINPFAGKLSYMLHQANLQPVPYETSSAVQRRKSASKWLHSGFAAEMQLFDSFPAVDVKLQRAAKTLCSSLKRFAANESALAAI